MLINDSNAGRTDKMVDLKITARELALQKEFVNSLTIEEQKKELALAVQIKNPQIVSDLYDAGFRAETADVIDLIPIAFVAWASGSVTADERKTVITALEQFEVVEKAVALKLFTTWLDTRPSNKLMTLWEDAMRAKREVLSDEVWSELGSRLLLNCREVAMASGGILGFGKICEAEQAVLDQVSDLFDFVNQS